MKTGALIRASVLMAARCSATLDARQYEALAAFGAAVGLAFQVQDDILDVEGDVNVIGKPPGSDEARGMPTYPATAGMAAAHAKRARAARNRDAAVARPRLATRTARAPVRLAARAEPLTDGSRPVSV